MRENSSNIDLGSVQIHKKALADIAATAISDIEGVTPISKDFKDTLLDLIGQKNSPGITVTVDKNNQVSIEVKVVIRYGMNISEIARHIQDAVRVTVERTTDIILREVNVNVQGIERGER